MSFARFCERVADFSHSEIFDAVLIEMLEVNRLYGAENHFEKMENGLPVKNTAARSYYNKLFSLLAVFTGSHNPELLAELAGECQDLIDKLA